MARMHTSVLIDKWRLLLIGLLLGFGLTSSVAVAARINNLPGYAVVVSRTTSSNAAWKPVIDTLIAKHHGSVIVFDANVDEALDSLRRSFPRYVCVVARSEEANQKFVADVHQLMRKIDDDPYADALWGILTGYDAADALRIAKYKQPMIVRRVAAGTEIALSACQEGVWYSELKQAYMVRKAPGEQPVVVQAPPDTTKAIVDTLNKYQPQLFVTSGHATQRDWRIGFGYKNGQFRSAAGTMSGVDTHGNRYVINSPNPKVYLPVGNCLMGNIDGPDAMALAWMHSVGVYQMIGYTVPTWFGYSGWGCLDYFVEQPGRYTFAEAFHANQHALIWCLTNKVGSQRGLAFDRDVVAFYGDPAWEARMAPGPLAWEQTFEQTGDVYTLTIEPRRGEKTFEPINTNGSQRGWRPIIQWFTHRVGDVEILEGTELNPVVTDDFILVPNPRKCDPNRIYRVRFRAAETR